MFSHSRFKDKESFIIISAEQSNASKDYNEFNTGQLIAYFDEMNVSYKQVIGVYKTDIETSFVVTGMSNEQATSLCRIFGQVCYLAVDKDRHAFLVYNERIEDIGKFRCLDSNDKDKLLPDSYTKDGDNIYICES